MKMYYIAVVLPPHLNEQILKFKLYMKEHYDCKVGLKSPAHITIIPPFWMQEDKEQELLADLANVSRQHQAFTVSTNHFACFKNKTIFIDVAANEFLNELKKSVEDYFIKRPYKIQSENRKFHPHITIATRDLHKQAFADAWPVFQHKKYGKQFTADGLSLLRHNGRSWDVIFDAPFKNP